MATKKSKTSEFSSRSATSSDDWRSALKEVYTVVDTGPSEYISTGIELLDLFLSAPPKEGDTEAHDGIKVGEIVELYGDTGIGKSTLVMHICSNVVNKLGRKVIYYDFEGGVSDNLLGKMDLLRHLYHPEKNPDGLFVCINPIYFKTWEIVMPKLLMDDNVVLQVVDSTKAVLSDYQDENSAEDNKPAIQASIYSKLMPKIKSFCLQRSAAMLMISQERMKINFRNPNLTKKDTSSPPSVQYHAGIRICIKRVSSLKKEVTTMQGTEEIVYGSIIRLESIKNRGNDKIPINLPIIFGYGVSNVMILRDALRSSEYVDEKGGGYITVDPRVILGDEGEGTEPIKLRGADNFNAFIKENFETVDRFVKEKNLLFYVKEDE